MHKVIEQHTAYHYQRFGTAICHRQLIILIAWDAATVVSAAVVLVDSIPAAVLPAVGVPAAVLPVHISTPLNSTAASMPSP
jgi:hypothetical protein